MKFSLTFWIADPDGMDNVKSEVMLALWDAFKREGIRVPYPVREIRVRGGALPVETTRRGFALTMGRFRRDPWRPTGRLRPSPSLACYCRRQIIKLGCKSLISRHKCIRP